MEQMALDTLPTGSSLSFDPLWFDESTTIARFRNPPPRSSMEIAAWFECPLEPMVTMMMGSGSVIRIACLSGDYVFAKDDLFLPDVAAKPAVTHSAQEMITFIRASLGISIAELAVFLKISRPAIYNWMDGQVPRRDSLRRIDHLYRLADFWNQACSWPIGKYIQQPVDGGKSLADLLATEVVDDQRVRTAMRQMGVVVTTAQEARERRSIAERLRAKGFRPVSNEEFQANLDATTPPANLPDPDEE